MKINRIADEHKAPSWCFEKADNFANIDTLSREEAKRLSSLPQSGVLTEAQVVNECDMIEKCAKKGSNYHYNSQWDKNTVALLKEYAVACNLESKKIIAASIETMEMVKTASVAVQEVKTAENKLSLSDPFHLDSISDTRPTDHKKGDWEKEGKQSNLTDKPTMMSNAIKAVRGGEDYNINPFTQTARGQNSIGKPDAIENFAKEEDTGARLRKENEEKRAMAKKNHEEWQKDKIDAMTNKEVLGLMSRRVFATESMNAQPGIKGEVYDYSKMPEKTDGEKINEANKEYRKQLRGEERAKHEFKVEVAAPRTISDSFTESLKKNLGK